MELYVGLMSGTSLDGIDAALVAFRGRAERPEEARLVAFHTRPYDDKFRERLREACRGGGPEELCLLSFELGHRSAQAALGLLEEAGVRPGEVTAVGSHGQTVWHSPPGGAGRDEGGCEGATLQLGEGAVIAEATGIPVVEDFRVRDVAAGGQGAPLTAYFDRVLLSSPTASRAIQNLGGMGNVTALPPEGSGGTPVAFDTGPGVALLDAAARRLTEGRLRCDEDGRLAARGRVSEAAVAEWLEDPFFGARPPRSTGRERFGDRRLEAWLTRYPTLSAEDALASLTELTARSISLSYRWIRSRPEKVYLCGGGARNPELCRRIRARLDPLPVGFLEELGWDGNAREAAAFALLARQHALGIAVGLEWATGSRGPRVLGKWVPA